MRRSWFIGLILTSCRGYFDDVIRVDDFTNQWWTLLGDDHYDFYLDQPSEIEAGDLWYNQYGLPFAEVTKNEYAGPWSEAGKNHLSVSLEGGLSYRIHAVPDLDEPDCYRLNFLTRNDVACPYEGRLWGEGD